MAALFPSMHLIHTCSITVITQHDIALILVMLYADLMPLVLLTKIDSYDPDVIGKDLTKNFHSARLLNLMEVSHSALEHMLHLQQASLCIS